MNDAQQKTVNLLVRHVGELVWTKYPWEYTEVLDKIIHACRAAKKDAEPKNTIVDENVNDDEL